MPITPQEVEVGAFYIAGESQLRQVIALDRDKDGTITFVDWVGKSANPPKNGVPVKGFPTAPNRANLPSISTFCKACRKRLNEGEIKELVRNKVLTHSESTSVYTIPSRQED